MNQKKSRSWWGTTAGKPEAGGDWRGMWRNTAVTVTYQKPESGPVLLEHALFCQDHSAILSGSHVWHILSRRSLKVLWTSHQAGVWNRERSHQGGYTHSRKTWESRNKASEPRNLGDRIRMRSTQMRSIMPAAQKRDRNRGRSPGKRDSLGPLRVGVGCHGVRSCDSNAHLNLCLLRITCLPEAQAPELREEEANWGRNTPFYHCNPPVVIKLVVRCKYLPKLHMHLLPTALNDWLQLIQQKRKATNLRIILVFPWSASLRSWMSLLGKLGDGPFIKSLY